MLVTRSAVAIGPVQRHRSVALALVLDFVEATGELNEFDVPQVGSAEAQRDSDVLAPQRAVVEVALDFGLGHPDAGRDVEPPLQDVLESSHCPQALDAGSALDGSQVLTSLVVQFIVVLGERLQRHLQAPV